MNPINILAVSLAPLALSLVFSGNLSAAESYHRWKDENGVTHYGSTPPTGVNSEKINARATPKTKAKDVVDDSTNLENTKKLLSAERQKTCERERQRLTTLKSSGANIRMKDENGKSKVLTPEEIAKEIHGSEAFLQQACS